MSPRLPRDARNQRILHIEDNRENRMLVRAILEADGYTVIDAEDGLSGIEAAIREQPDLMLLDVNLPGVDGYEVVSIIKSFPNFATTPVIAVTAYAMEGDRQRTLVAGCDGYIQKPIDVDAFPRQVAEFLRGKREHVEAREEGIYLRELNQRLVFRLVNQVEELKRLNQHFVRRAGQLADLHRAVQDITSEVGVTALLEGLLPQLARALGATSLSVELTEPPGVRVAVAGDGADRPRSVLRGAIETVEDWVEVEWALPLAVRGRTLGTMVARQPLPPGAKADEEQLLNIVANQLAIAVENSRLYERTTHSYEETQQQLRHTETLLSVSQAVGTTLDLTEVLRRTARALARALGADIAGGWLLAPAGDLAIPLVGYHVPKDLLETYALRPLPTDHPLIGEVIRSHGPIYASDSQADPRFEHPLTEVLPHRSALVQPIVLKGETIGGFALVWTKESHAFTGEELQLVEGIGRQTAMAIENARLLDAERQARAELEASETRYRDLFENALDVVYLHAIDGRLLAVNEAGVRASGYSRTELLGMKIGQLMEPDGVPGGAEELTRRMLAGGHGSELVAAELVTKAGGRVPLECSARVIVKDGAPVAIQGVARDITIRRKLEARQTAFVEIVAELAAQDDFDRLLALIGRRVCELTGAESAVISLVEGDELVFSGLHNFEATDDTPVRRKIAESRFGRVVADRRPYPSSDMRADPQWGDSTLVRAGYRAILDVPIILRDQVIGVLGVLSRYSRAFSEEDVALLVSLAGHTAIAIDRTNLVRQLKGRLEETQTLLSVSQAVVSTLDLTEMMRRVAKETARALGADMVGAYLADADQKVLRPIAGYHVPRRLLEFFAKEPVPLRGHRFLEEAWERRQTVASTDAPSDPRLHREFFGHMPHRSILFTPMIVRGEPIGGLFVVWWEQRHRVSPDELRLMQGIASQAAIAIENSRLYEGVKRRMAELKQTQAQLIQSTKLAAIGELAANIAHEINNPLTSVLGFASFLAERLEPGAPTLEELMLIQEEAARARDIVRDLLQFSRQSEFLPAMTDLNVVVEQVVGMVRRQGAVEGIEVGEVYAADLPLVEVDVSRIKQVFLNILNNAIYAMPDGGALTIRTSVADGVVHVEFTDTGLGIAADDLGKIFDPFFTTKPDVSGTGLGLSVSLGIVQSHGGTIEVTSELRTGSRFTVKLPVEPRSSRVVSS